MEAFGEGHCGGGEEMMNKDLIVAKLDLIAAQAKELSISFKEDRLWEGELGNGVGKIHSEAQQLCQLVRDDRR